MTYINRLSIDYRDGPNTDSMSRLRIAPSSTLWALQHTYDLNPLLMETSTSGTGATVTYGSDGFANLAFSSTPTGGAVSIQSYECIPYIPGRSQTITMALVMSGATNVVKFAGYSNGSDGVQFEIDGTTVQFTHYSVPTGDTTTTQANWSLDKLDGTGASGLTLDVTDLIIVVFDILKDGRIRCGFNIGGRIYWAHVFETANQTADQAFRSAALPIRAGMTCTATVTTALELVSASVTTDEAPLTPTGYSFAQEGTVTASSGTRTHILSIRPRATFNSVTNRAKIVPAKLEILAGAAPVYWELVIGQAISGTTTFNNVNATYSTVEYNTLGTISGSPAVVIDSGYAYTNTVVSRLLDAAIASAYPITLDAAGSARTLGTLSVLVTGIGGTSDCRASLGWREIR